MYILFEGLDLAGKSTMCRRFVEKAGKDWSIRNNSISDNNQIYELANVLRKKKLFDEKTIGFLYYSALLGDIELFKRPAGNIVQDSTIVLRSLAYHKTMGTEILPELFDKIITTHPRFDFAFVCSASKEARLRRLAIRRKENLGPEDFIVRDAPDIFFRMENTLIHYAKTFFNAEVIDTGSLEEPAESDRLLDYLMTRTGIKPGRNAP